MVRDTVGAFAREEIAPAARPADESGEIPAALIAKAWQLGLVRGPLPERLGGDGDTRSALTGAIIAEELAAGDLAIATHILAPRLFAFPILEMGTDAQRDTYLRRFTGPDFIPAGAALMEPRFDFDAVDLQTRARADGSGFILDGRKCMVALASASEAFLVYAAGNGDSRVQAFIVPRGVSGLTVRDREKNMGLKALETFEVEFSECRLGPEAKLGGEAGIDHGRILSQSRVALAAMAVGMSRAAFDYARAYAKERRAFGAPIATRQAVAFMLADMAIEVDASRLLAWEAAWRLDRGEDAARESYLARNYVASAALKIADNAVQTLGGHGYIREHPVEMYLRNARGFATLEGLATV